MSEVTQFDIEQYRQKIRKLSMQIPQKSARSREAILAATLYNEIENLRKSGHEWARIAEGFGQEIKWKSLQSSFSREKKKRVKSKKNPSPAVAIAPAPVAPPPPAPPPQPLINLKF